MNSNRSSTSNDAKPTREQIAVRAELLWKAKGSPEGRDEEIWLEAERQLYDEARELISDLSKTNSEEPNPAMGSRSSAAEEMATPPSPAPQPAAPRGPSRKKAGGR